MQAFKITIDLDALGRAVETLPTTDHVYIEEIYKSLSRCVRVLRTPFNKGDVIGAWLRLHDSTENKDMRSLCNVYVSYSLYKEAAKDKAVPAFVSQLEKKAAAMWLTLIGGKQTKKRPRR